jgi:4-hydroxy-3-methylbut-2-en-1-yl diphosphate reductase
MVLRTDILRVLLAKPRGFCAGVERAIEIVERALERYGAPVYVRHEIVHNRQVVEDLRARGAIFVNEVDEIPAGAITVFSAHGVSHKVESHAAGRQLDVIDATCPLVLKVHKEGRRYASLDYDIVLIGHDGHPEVEGTRGQIEGRLHVICSVEEVAALVVRNPERVAYITQTTLSILDTRTVIDALNKRFPNIVGPEMRNICYATQNRQKAILDLVDRVQAIVVVGGHNSSNSRRLREIGESAGLPSYLIDRPETLKESWLNDVAALGLTAGASAPERLVQETIERIRKFRPVVVETCKGLNENVQFRLPQRLLEAAQTASVA